MAGTPPPPVSQFKGLSRFSIHPLDRLGQWSLDPIEGMERLRRALAHGFTVPSQTAADGTTDAPVTTTAPPVNVQTDVIRWGKVTSTSPLEVQFAADTAGVAVGGVIGAYTPVVDDVVVLLRVGVQWGIVGDWSAA